MEFLSFMYEIRGSECEGVSRWWDGWDDTVDGRVGITPVSSVVHKSSSLQPLSAAPEFIIDLLLL